MKTKFRGQRIFLLCAGLMSAACANQPNSVADSEAREAEDQANGLRIKTLLFTTPDSTSNHQTAQSNAYVKASSRGQIPFTVLRPARISLSLEGQGLTFGALKRLDAQQSGARLTTVQAAPRLATTRFEASLEPGDYTLELRNSGESLASAKVRASCDGVEGSNFVACGNGTLVSQVFMVDPDAPTEVNVVRTYDNGLVRTEVTTDGEIQRAIFNLDTGADRLRLQWEGAGVVARSTHAILTAEDFPAQMAPNLSYATFDTAKEGYSVRTPLVRMERMESGEELSLLYRGRLREATLLQIALLVHAGDTQSSDPEEYENDDSLLGAADVETLMSNISGDLPFLQKIPSARIEP